MRTGIPTEEDLGKIHRTIQRYEVRRRKRWLKTVSGEKMESLSVLVEFQSKGLPEYDLTFHHPLLVPEIWARRSGLPWKTKVSKVWR